MRSHKYGTHGGTIKYNCNICSKEFYQKTKIETHCKSHLNIRPFKCDTCDKSFKLKGHLTTHLKTHLKDKKYKC